MANKETTAKFIIRAEDRSASAFVSANRRGRRRLAYSGPLPPSSLAARFTTGELAVLRIVGDEIRDRGTCTLPMDAIAARAGVCRELARRALRHAEREGLVTITERRLTGSPFRISCLRHKLSASDLTFG